MSSETVPGSTPSVSAPIDTFCFRVKEQRQGWSVLRPVPAATGVNFSDLVRQAPEFLGMVSSGPAVRAAVQLPGIEAAGAVVLVAVDDAGGLTLVGCPSKNDRDDHIAVARELIGQHGRLWRMSFEAFSAAADKALGRPLVQLMAEKAGAGFSEAEFKAAVTRSLDQGRFPAVVLLDDVGSEATEALDYLKSLGVNVRLLGVEFSESRGVEIVQPRLISAAEPVQPAEAQTRPVAQPSPRVGGIAPASVATFGGASTTIDVDAKPTVWPQAEPPKQTQPTRPAAVEPNPASAPPFAGPAGKARDETKPDGGVKPTVWPQAEPLRQTQTPRPVPAEPEPATVQPAPDPSEKVWDGTKPGVMSGKRPPPKPPEGRR